MKNFRQKLVFICLFAVTGTFVMAQDGNSDPGSSIFGNIWNWVLTVGIGSLAALFPTFWKKIKAISFKITGIVLLGMDELDNVRLQIVEAKAAGRAILEHYKIAIADDNLSKEEQEGFVTRFETFLDELDDIPEAFKNAISKIKAELRKNN